MKFLITPIAIILAVVGGSVLGHAMLADAPSSPSDHAAEPPKEKGAAHGPKGHGKSGGATAEAAYFKFSREFVVPIMRDQRVSALVILNINLETSADGNSALFRLEPKLRDNIMTTLISLANEPGVLDSIATIGNYETVRSAILSNLSRVTTDVSNILILDMAKQDL